MTTINTVLLELRPLGGGIEGGKQQHVAVVRLNRPAVHNAIDGATIERLEEVVERLDAADPPAVVLASSGPATFCAGGDLTYFTEIPDAATAEAMSRRMQAVLARLEDGRRPVIAAIDGDVLGGGCEIATACHLRIAATGVTFSFRPAALGIVTGWGGGRRLIRLLGRSAALRLLLLAEKIDAPEALRLGLVDRVVEPGSAEAEALRWAARIAGNARGSVRGFLALDRELRHEDDGDGGDVATLETRLFGELWEGETFQHVLAEWRGRSERRREDG